MWSALDVGCSLSGWQQVVPTIAWGHGLALGARHPLCMLNIRKSGLCAPGITLERWTQQTCCVLERSTESTVWGRSMGMPTWAWAACKVFCERGCGWAACASPPGQEEPSVMLWWGGFESQGAVFSLTLYSCLRSPAEAFCTSCQAPGSVTGAETLGHGKERPMQTPEGNVTRQTGWLAGLRREARRLQASSIVFSTCLCLGQDLTSSYFEGHCYCDGELWSDLKAGPAITSWLFGSVHEKQWHLQPLGSGSLQGVTGHPYSDYWENCACATPRSIFLEEKTGCNC